MRSREKEKKKGKVLTYGKANSKNNQRLSKYIIENSHQ